MAVTPNTQVGTKVRVTNSGKTGVTTGNQRWRSAGGMNRLAHEVKLNTGATTWATFLEVLEDEKPVQDGHCAKCGEDMESRWATAKCYA